MALCLGRDREDWVNYSFQAFIHKNASTILAAAVCMAVKVGRCPCPKKKQELYVRDTEINDVILFMSAALETNHKQLQYYSPFIF